MDEESRVNDFEREVADYRKLESQFREEFHTSIDEIYYVLSKKFLDKWKERVGYNGSRGSGEPIPKNLNNALLVDKPNIILKYEPVDTHMWTFIIDPALQEGTDFEVVSEPIWNFFNKKYTLGKAIQRDSQVTNGFKTVNVKLMKIKMAIIFPSNIQKFKNGKSATLIKGDQYVSRTYRVRDYQELFQRTLQTVTGFHFLKQNSVRFYKCPAGMTSEQLEDHITKELKDCNHYDDPMFELKDSEYLDPERYETLEDCNIEPDQWVMLDAKEMQKNWCVKNPNFPMEGKCEGCYNFKILQFPCECKKVSYCSEDCKRKDEQYHMQRCEKTDSDEETMDKLARTETSVDGRCGLRNLGNTCFMNSGLQCLSNTPELTEYILTNGYKVDVNLDNLLGTKGELSSKYAHLIKRMWFGDKQSHPPFSFKRAIGKFQPQFQGYQQHDSQELITYLLDGLNEDLNRVKKKPYVEGTDHLGRPDHIVALEAWQNFRKRNDSVIVDNMYGLYKSQLRCPTCQKESITFDPYLMVNVSIPQATVKKMELNYISTDMLWNLKTFQYEYDKSSALKVRNIFEQTAVEHWMGEKIDFDQLVLTVTSNYNQEDVTLDEPIKSLKKKLKFKKFYIRRLLPEEVIPTENKVGILIHESYRQYQAYTWKRDITPSLSFFFSLDSTPREIHLFTFKIHLGLLATFEGLQDIQAKVDAEGLEEAYKKYILEEVWVMEFKSNQRYMQNCSYCDQAQCNDCLVPMSDDSKVRVWLEREKDLHVEVHVVWKRGFTKEGRQEDIYDDWLKSQSKGKMETQEIAVQTSKVNPQLTLQECLRFSSQPEQLEEDNTWYCNKCQDHVKAFKTMEIYTTPKILIFHLKRFKSSNKYFKSKLEALIDFPVDGLDMSGFVKEANMPSQMNIEGSSSAPVIYDLYAISNHFGGLGGGHYTAFAKNRHDNQWYNFDDSHVSPVTDTKQLLTSAAYVLFYKRRE